MPQIRISVSELLGKNIALLYNDGLTLYDELRKKFSSEGVIISFNDINQCTTAFLNSSIGKFLMNSDDPTKVVKLIKFEGASKDSILDRKINMVIDNAINHQKSNFYNHNLRMATYTNA